MSTKNKRRENLVYQDRFEATIIFTDNSHTWLELENVEIKIKDTKSLKLSVIEKWNTPFNFSEFQYLILDLFTSTGEIKVRKIFKILFHSYTQHYTISSSTPSILDLEFEILNFEVQQDENLQTIESLIREFKINNITDLF